MTISDEAVEAAARAAYELKPVELFGREHPVTWEQLSDSPLGQRRKDNELATARTALRAAAPHMLARPPLVQEFGPLDAAKYQPIGHGPTAPDPFMSPRG